MNEFVAEQHIDNSLKHYYFRNFRWILHLAYWLFVYVRNQLIINEPVFFTEGFLYNFLFDNIFIILFYYFYALFLVPKYLKKNKFRPFFLGIIISFLLLPLVDLFFHYNFIQLQPERYHYLNFSNPDWAALIMRMYKSYLFNFLLFAAYLFFIETADGIAKFHASTKADSTIMKSQRQSLQTHVEPEFIMNTLSGINSLAASNDAKTSGSIIQFSEILRYRLYKSKSEQTSLLEELQQIKNLFDLYNNLSNKQFVLEVEGDAKAIHVYSSSLLSLVLKILSTSKHGDNTNIVLYILSMQNEVDIAIEWESDYKEKIAVVKNLKSQLSEFYEDKFRLDFDIVGALCSLRVHLVSR